ncbi:hypothetical protein ACET3Z_012036 [Daucus carota]
MEYNSTRYTEMLQAQENENFQQVDYIQQKLRSKVVTDENQQEQRGKDVSSENADQDENRRGLRYVTSVESSVKETTELEIQQEMHDKVLDMFPEHKFTSRVLNYPNLQRVENYIAQAKDLHDQSMSTADSLLADPMPSEQSKEPRERPDVDEDLAQKFIKDMRMRRESKNTHSELPHQHRNQQRKEYDKVLQDETLQGIEHIQEAMRSYSAENVLETHVYEDPQGIEYIRELGDARSVSTVYVLETVDGYKQGIEYIREAWQANNTSTARVTPDERSKAIDYAFKPKKETTEHENEQDTEDNYLKKKY